LRKNTDKNHKYQRGLKLWIGSVAAAARNGAHCDTKWYRGEKGIPRTAVRIVKITENATTILKNASKTQKRKRTTK